jgi:hypothetical protein
MSDLALRLDSPASTVRKLAAVHGFNDPHHRGELQQVFDGRGRSLRYLRPRGVTLDTFGEILLDRGVTYRRLVPDEVHRLLVMSFDATVRAVQRKEPTAKQITRAEQKARRNRNRLYQCPESDCQQRARGTRHTSLICGLCYEMKAGKVVYLVRIDPLPEEIVGGVA